MDDPLAALRAAMDQLEQGWGSELSPRIARMVGTHINYLRRVGMSRRGAERAGLQLHVRLVTVATTPTDDDETLP